VSRVIITAMLGLTGLLAGPRVLAAQDVAAATNDDMATRIWFDRGDEPLLERGAQVRIYYHTSVDAYVAIFNIDTNGTVRLVFPRSPEEAHYVRGGHDYRLLFPGSEYWSVDDHPGIGYFFTVASPQPFDFGSVDYSYYDRGWDLTRIGQSVYTDPYVAMDDYVAALIPDWEYVPYALDFATYQVGSTPHDYPRFLCYDCHDFRPYTVWNPYLYECTSFRVVVYTDPWYYPSYRYRGDRVVYTRPPRPGTPRFEFKERADGDPFGVEYVARPPVADRPGVGGDPALRRSELDAVTETAPAVGGASPGSRSTAPPGVPTDILRLRRGGTTTTTPGVPQRPTQVLPGRSGTGDIGAERRAVPPTSTGVRPILERRSGDGGEASGSAEPDAGTPERPSNPDPVRTRTGTPSAPSPPGRVPTPTGSRGDGSGTATPRSGGSGSPPTPAGGLSQGSPRTTRPTPSTPVIRRDDATDSRWVPVLGGNRGAESTGSGANPGSAQGAPSTPATPRRGGVVIFEGTPESPGYTVTREGGVLVYRARGSSRPTDAVTGSGATGGVPEGSTGAPAPQSRRATPSQNQGAVTTSPTRPSERARPTSAGTASSVGGSGVGRSSTAPSTRAAPPPRAGSGGASVPRPTGGSAPTGRTSGTPATVRRPSGGSASPPPSTPRSSRGGASSTGGGAVIRRR
jgi:hypothetical protein